MDGLLLNTERMAIRAWDMALREYGYQAPEGFALSFLGRGSDRTAEGLLDLLGKDAPVRLIKERRHEIGQQMVRDASPGELRMPGALELLCAAQRLGVPACVCTSTERDRAAVKLDCAGLSPYIAAVVPGDEVARGKPFPDIFLAGATALRVPIAYCAALEDAPAGIRAAADSGALVYAIPDLMPVPADLLPRVTVCASLLEAMASLFP